MYEKLTKHHNFIASVKHGGGSIMVSAHFISISIYVYFRSGSLHLKYFTHIVLLYYIIYFAAETGRCRKCLFPRYLISTTKEKDLTRT